MLVTFRGNASEASSSTPSSKAASTLATTPATSSTQASSQNVDTCNQQEKPLSISPAQDAYTPTEARISESRQSTASKGKRTEDGTSGPSEENAAAVKERKPFFSITRLKNKLTEKSFASKESKPSKDGKASGSASEPEPFGLPLTKAKSLTKEDKAKLMLTAYHNALKDRSVFNDAANKLLLENPAESIFGYTRMKWAALAGNTQGLEAIDINKAGISPSYKETLLARAQRQQQLKQALKPLPDKLKNQLLMSLVKSNPANFNEKFQLPSTLKLSNELADAFEAANPVELMSALIASGANVNHENARHNESLLHAAAEATNTPAVRVLAAAGATPARFDVLFNLPLHSALSRRDLDSALILAELGKNINQYEITNLMNQTPLDLLEPQQHAFPRMQLEQKQELLKAEYERNAAEIRLLKAKENEDYYSDDELAQRLKSSLDRAEAHVQDSRKQAEAMTNEIAKSQAKWQTLKTILTPEQGLEQ